MNMNKKILRAHMAAEAAHAKWVWITGGEPSSFDEEWVFKERSATPEARAALAALNEAEAEYWRLALTPEGRAALAAIGPLQSIPCPVPGWRDWARRCAQ